MKLNIKLNSVLFLLITLLCLSGQTATAEGIVVERIVVFGDSLSDQGKLYKRFQHVVPSSPPYWRGRFSNGPIWADLLAEKYPLANESEGGASTVDYRHLSTDLKYKIANNLGNEVSQFLEKSTFKSTDLVIMWFGGNDYMSYNWNSPADIERVVLEHVIQIKRIQLLGVKHFLVINLPDMGKAPFHKDEQSRQLGSDVTEYHNLHMQAQLDQTFDSDTVQIMDVFGTLRDAMNSPQSHGFQNTTDACFHGSYWGGILWTAHDRTSPLVLTEYSARQDFLRSIMSTSNAPIQAPFLEQQDFLRSPTHTSNAPIQTPLRIWASTPKCEGYIYMDHIHPSHDTHKIIARMLDEYIQQHYRAVDQ